MAPLRVLTFTSLYPSEARPRHGIFVETRLAHLRQDWPVDVRVIAPVPWFPFRADAFGTYARFAATPRRTVRPNGVPVAHPRYLMVPRVGVAFQPDSMARAALPDVARWQAEGWRPDLIDAHYLYPDGVAAALLAERLGLPFVMTARGTDVNVLARMPGPGRRIQWAVERAARVVTVSSRLKDVLVELGADADKIVVLRNGVDTAVFAPADRAEARRRLGLPDGPLAACVGNLLPEKGFDLAIDALRRLDGWRLLLVGDGPQREALAEQARVAGLGSRVMFRGAMPQRDLRHAYAAADVLLLTSRREGWPNVVLESMACGTPVVATDVGAVGDMITSGEVGRILPTRDPAALASAVHALAATRAAPASVAAHAAAYGWGPISAAQYELMCGAARPHRAPASAAREAALAGE